MVTNNEIYMFLCSLAPLELQMDFDNSGFLLGHKEAVADKVLLSLDVTDDVIEEAEELGAKLIITHHPIIFSALKNFTDNMLLRMAEDGISVISMHTNLDIAQGGVNDVLISKFDPVEVEVLDEDGCGRIGTLRNAMEMGEFLSKCKEVLNTAGLRYLDCGRKVNKLAVMGGAGGDSIAEAFEKGCDTYLTSDIKYHQFLLAKELGINLIDGDHFCTENLIIPVLEEKLKHKFTDVHFSISTRHKQVIAFF